jgi:protein-disulfide isomerase
VFASAIVLAAADAALESRSSDDSGHSNDIVGIVGTRTIRARDLEEYWQEHDPAGFARIKQQLREGERQALDGLVAEYLLEREAGRQKLTVEQLLHRVGESAEPPTDAEIRETFDQSSASAQGIALDVAAPMITNYLRQRKSDEAQRRYIEDLKRSTALDIRLPSEGLRQVVESGPTDPRVGPFAAPVEIVEFSDFECPYCKRAVPTLKQILSKYRDQVKLVWKDFPLPMHPSARSAAEAAQCANEQGKFWEYHDLLFQHQDALTAADLISYAVGTGLKMSAFNECLESGRAKERVAAGIRDGTKHGVNATPTVFINGRIVMGAVPFESYEQVVREELAARRSPGVTR